MQSFKPAHGEGCTCLDSKHKVTITNKPLECTEIYLRTSLFEILESGNFYMSLLLEAEMIDIGIHKCKSFFHILLGGYILAEADPIFYMSRRIFAVEGEMFPG